MTNSIFFLLLQLILPLWCRKDCRKIWCCSWVVTNDVRIISLPLEIYAFLLLFRTFRFVRILCWVKGIYELHQYAILVFMNSYFGNMPWSYASLLLHLHASTIAFLELVNLKVHNVNIPLMYELHVSFPNRRQLWSLCSSLTWQSELWKVIRKFFSISLWFESDISSLWIGLLSLFGMVT